MATTLTQLESRVYDALNENSSSSVYPSDWIDDLINEAQEEICFLKQWPFLQKKYLFNTAADTTVSTAISAADTSAVLSATSTWPTAGAGFVEDDIFTHTGNAANTLSGIPASGTGAFDIAHAAGKDVKPIYAVPSDFWKANMLKVNSQELTPDDYRLVDLTGSKYAIYQDYIFLPVQTSAVIAVLYYSKKPTTMSSGTDNATIPDEYAKKVIVPLVTHKAFLYRDEFNKAQSFLADYNRELRNMLGDFGFRNASFRSRIKSYR